MNKLKFIEIEHMDGRFILININNISHISPQYFKDNEHDIDCEFATIHMTNGNELDVVNNTIELNKLIINQ